MTYQVFARKWRPQKFQDVIGQGHITRSLQNAILNKRLGHAYLLTGTRGIGKTSVARIFAKALRCTKVCEDGNACGKCLACLDVQRGASLDVQELDGASHNKVEEIRELIGTVQTLPASGNYKVYIIDEVHMLSVAAFNALLKTLEEPPGHVIFILATTAAEKLPNTVLSRCQRFDFRNATTAEVGKLIEKISTAESIHFEREELIGILAEQAKGSVRDALSLFEQVLSYTVEKAVTEDVLVSSLGLAKTGSVNSLVENLLTGKAAGVVELFQGMSAENVPVENIATAILNRLYHVIDSKELRGDVSEAELFWLYENLAQDMQWVMATLLPEKSLAIVLKKLALRRQLLPTKAQPSQSVAKVTRERGWEDFLKHIQGVAPSLASNLKQGNVLSLENVAGKLSCRLAFGYAEKIFGDHVRSEEVCSRLKDLMGKFFQAEISLEVVMLEKKEDANFKSLASREEEGVLQSKERLKDGIMQSPMLKEAERLFQTKVEHIRVTE